MSLDPVVPDAPVFPEPRRLAASTSDEWVAVALSRSLCMGDLDAALAMLVEWPPDAKNACRGQREVVVCQMTLLLRFALPCWLRGQWEQLEFSASAEVRELVTRVRFAESVTSGERAVALEAAAFALIWLEQPFPTLVTQYLLLDATRELDGPDVADRLLARVLDHGAGSPLLALLRACIAADRGNWKAAVMHSEVCLESGGWLAQRVMPVWLLALAEERDDTTSFEALTRLPDDLHTSASRAMLAGLLWDRGDLAPAAGLWKVALNEGWADFDLAFASALPTIALDEEAIRFVATAGSGSKRSAIVMLAHRVDLSDDVVARLVALDQRDVRVALAENPAMSAETLAELAAAGPFEAIAVAGNPATPPDLLEKLACRAEASVRRAVAASVHCPLSVLSFLALDDEAVVLQAIRGNPMSPEALRVHVALKL